MEILNNAERIKQATDMLHPHTTHESGGDKIQQVINDVFEILEWGHLTGEVEEQPKP